MAGFRKSLFGFNTDDVLSYIERTHKDFTQKEESLSEEIKDLKKTVETLKKQIDLLEEAKNYAESELKVYKDKERELERLSENIGKLYLVANENALAIMKNAEESKLMADEEIKRNINVLKEAHKSLESIKIGVAATNEEFKQRVDNLTSSLKSTENNIQTQTEESDNSINEFQNVYETIN